MVQPASSFSSVTLALARIVCGAKFIVPSWAESAIAKQAAWAAPINSSGLVPLAFSKRVRKEYGESESTPLGVEIDPLPSFNPPFQTAVALRSMISSYVSEFLFIRHWMLRLIYRCRTATHAPAAL